MTGPLQGVTVIEMAGIGPGPFACMMLADMGARVIRIDRPARRGAKGALDTMMSNDSIIDRGRESLALNMKDPRAAEAVLRLVERADVLIEGFRPGVAEQMGIGPAVCLQRNPKLVFGRMTGWGQSGPLSQAAGHDLNYISLAGALHAMGGAHEPPRPPLNLVGDYGGGGTLLVVGVLAALLEARGSGRGQVVDAAMCDGALQLMAPIFGMLYKQAWHDRREDNVLDGAAPFYACYACADGRYLSVAPIEPQFFAELVRRLELPEGEGMLQQWDRADWPRQRALLTDLFARRTRDQWCALLEGSDACFAPVLSMTEAPQHAHTRARGGFVQRDGQHIPAPAPRFSRTASEVAAPAPVHGRDTRRLLREVGLTESDLEAWLTDGAAQQA